MASSSESNSVAGITMGFFVGIVVVFGLEKVVGYLENLPPNTFELLPGADGEETVHGISFMQNPGTF
jgi:hypothetical protein